jgi:hypothetical protein
MENLGHSSFFQDMLPQVVKHLFPASVGGAVELFKHVEGGTAVDNVGHLLLFLHEASVGGSVFQKGDRLGGVECGWSVGGDKMMKTAMHDRSMIIDKIND